MLKIKLIQKSISPLISIILLILVAIVIVTMVLSWGRDFTISSISKTSTILEEDTTTILDFEEFSKGNLYFKNISPIGTDPVTITGYSIISPTHHRLLNTLNNLDTNITLNPGQTEKINIPTPPETDFYVNLYTSDNTYIKLSNVKKSKDVEPFSKIFNSGSGDFGYSVEQTTDGGYIIVGYKYNGSNYDVWLVKTDSEGVEDWNKTFDSGYDDYAYSVEETNDNGYIITGYKNTGLSNVWLIKTDSSGNEDWNKTFDSGYGVGYSVKQTSDGGYIIASTTEGITDVWIIKTDSEGNENWNKIIGSSGASDFARSIEQTSDGGYIIVGNKYNGKTQEIWLIKIDSNGNKVWDRIFGGKSYYSYGYSVEQTTDGGYIIIGYTNENSDYDFWLIKTDSSGNEDWNKTFDAGDNDYGYSVEQTTDGGYIIVGYKYNGSNYDVWLIKTDSSGNEDWNKTFGGSNDDYGRFVEQTTDGGYIITGQFHNGSNSDFWLIKTDSEGNT